MLLEHACASQHVVTEGSNLSISRHHGKIEALLTEIRSSGRLPKEVKKSKDENQRKETNSAVRLRRLRKHMSEAQRQELANIGVA